MRVTDNERESTAQGVTHEESHKSSKKNLWSDVRASWINFLRSTLRSLIFARRQGDHTPLAKPSSLSHLRAVLTGILWRVMRFVIPRPIRLKVHEWFVKQVLPEPVSRTVEATGSVEKRQGKLGLTIVGPLSAEMGIGEGARNAVRAAVASGIQTALLDILDFSASRLNEELPPTNSSDVSHGVKVFHFNAPAMLAQLPMLGAYYDRNDYNIGYWVWETSELPDSWIDAFGFMHEIWTASAFCQDVISRKSPLPVIRIPHCIKPLESAQLSKEDLGLPPKGFVFLAMADFFSTPERKNPLGALEAFRRAFGSSTEEVFLVIKLSNGAERPEILELVQREAAADSRIILKEGYLDRPVLNALINTCDGFVSLHRSEGFGLPIAEAMYMGKPVVATGWSGNMDFMSFDNSLPVRYRLIPVLETVEPYSLAKGFWADPDLDHAAYQMRKLAADDRYAAELGQVAQKTIRWYFSAETVGDLMYGRLTFIREYLGR